MSNKICHKCHLSLKCQCIRMLLRLRSNFCPFLEIVISNIPVCSSQEWMPHTLRPVSFPSPLVRLGPAINDRFMALKVLERSANWPSFQLHCSLRYLTPCQVIFYPKKSFSSFLGHVLWFLLWMLFFFLRRLQTHGTRGKKKINLKGNEVAQVNFVQATKMVGNLHSYLTL